MQSMINVPVEISLLLGDDGVDLYVAEEELPRVTYSLDGLTEEFLDYLCDADGKVYRELSGELDALIQSFQRCLALLENAKH